MVKSGQVLVVPFCTSNPDTGAGQNADSLPTVTLRIDGVANAATVTVTNTGTGGYDASVTLPTFSGGESVSLVANATVNTSASPPVPIFTDIADTKRVGDLKDEAMRGTDDALLAADYTAPPTDYATAAALAAAKVVVDDIKTHTDTLDEATGTNTLTFRLLLDSDGDGTADDPAVGVVGITCHLLDSTGTTRIRESQTTDSQGYVYWHGLADGDYVVDPDDAAYEGVTVDVTLPE